MGILLTVDPLAGVVGKLDRGFAHLEEAERKVAAFLHEKPWHITHKADPKRGWKTGVFVIEREPPLEWSILIGEAMGQFHSSLDHLMTELARLRHTGYIKRPDRSPNFPICSSPGEFWRVSAMTGKVPANAVRRAVRPEHFAELERVQPREPEDVRPRGGGWTFPLALFVIRASDNVNKHATVRPALMSPREANYREVDPNILGFDPIWEPMAPLYNGTKLYRVKFAGKPEVGVPFDVVPEVDFAMSPLHWLPIDTIRMCGESVARIVQRFRTVTPEFDRRSHETPPES